MRGELATYGQQRVISEERREKMERKTDGQINTQEESQEIPGLWL